VIGFQGWDSGGNWTYNVMDDMGSDGLCVLLLVSLESRFPGLKVQRRSDMEYQKRKRETYLFIPDRPGRSMLVILIREILAYETSTRQNGILKDP
jgi:hypothetical protein